MVLVNHSLLSCFRSSNALRVYRLSAKTVICILLKLFYLTLLQICLVANLIPVSLPEQFDRVDLSDKIIAISDQPIFFQSDSMLIMLFVDKQAVYKSGIAAMVFN